MTMQKAVGIPSENEDEEESWHVGKLEDDFIIADEFGMCDMYLADRFFSAIKGCNPCYDRRQRSAWQRGTRKCIS